MDTVATQVSKYQANAVSVSSIWGGIVINVKSTPFLAKGDGVTDDTVSIQAAVDYAISIGKKEITFPAGTYKYGILTNTSGLTFIGDGVTLIGTTPITMTSLAAHEAETVTGMFNVKAGFGAKGDGITDDTAAIKAAIHAAVDVGGGTVYIPRGVYRITSTIEVLSASVSLIGDGAGWYAWINEDESNVTTLKWDDALGTGPMVRYRLANFGFRMDSIKLDCNTKATIGLEIDSSQGGEFSNLSILNSPTIACLKLTTSTMTCSWNTFTNLRMQNLVNSNTKTIWLTGGGGYNTCHNTFINTKADFGGSDSHGIYLGNCDNNAFFSVFTWRYPGDNGRGVYCDPSEDPIFPTANNFYHLQASDGGWYQVAGVAGNSVFGYATDNGQPDPVLNGGELVWSDNNGRIHPIRSLNGHGSKPGSNLTINGHFPPSTAYIDLLFPLGNEPDDQYAVFFSLFTDIGTSQLWISNRTASGFRVNITAPLAYDVFFSGLIVRL